MLTLEELNTIKNDMTAIVDAMQTRLDSVMSKITKIKGETTRSMEWIRDEVNKAEKDALPFFGESLDRVNELARLIKPQQVAWASKPLLLSRQTVKDRDVDDAIIKLRMSDECARMERNLLQLTADNAIEEGNLPLLYQAYLASLKTHSDAGNLITGIDRIDIDLSNVEIPEQKEALDAIRACLQYPAKAELIAGQSTTVSMTALRKLQLGRQAAA